MTLASTLTYIAICLIAFALVSKRISTTPLTGPILFVGFGILASGPVLGIIDHEALEIDLVVDLLFQATLVLVLFTDAATLNFSAWKEDINLPGRLLAVSLPLTIAAGAAVSLIVFVGIGVWEAAIIGAIIAPTDAALGQAVVSNPRVPERIRQALDVESGLNDGISLPFVIIFVSLAEQAGETATVLVFVREIGIAAAVGVVIGVAGAWLLSKSLAAGWVTTAWVGIAVIAVAGLSFLVADELGGSGFISAFVAGLAYGQSSKGRLTVHDGFAANLGVLLIQASFLIFGAAILVPTLEHVGWRPILVAVLALTVARMVPTAISMIGAHLSVPSILYMGWFGPRGLATIVFAVLVVVHADLANIDVIVVTAVTTVGLSVILHGATSYWGSQKYGDWYEQADKDGLLEAKGLSGDPSARTRGRHRLMAAAEAPPASGGSDVG